MNLDSYPRVKELSKRELFKYLLQKEVTDQIVPTENNGRVDSPKGPSYFQSHQVELRIHPRIIRYLSYSEKLRVYTVLRILSFLKGGNVYGLVLLDFKALLDSRLSPNSKEYFRLSRLSDKEFLEEIEATLKPKGPNRRAFFREINSIIEIGKQSLQLKQLIPRYLEMNFVTLSKKRKKRKVFRKGHNDHGSLGNTDHILQREEGEYIYRTEELPQAIENRVIHEIHTLLGDVITEQERRRLNKKL